MMDRFVFSLLLSFLALRASHGALVDDELFNGVMAGIEEEKASSKDRELLGIFNKEEGMTGDNCGPFSGTTCGSGLECRHVGLGQRCAPRKDCIQEGAQEWNEKFDVQAYKQTVFQAAGVTEEQILETRKLLGNDTAFALSEPVQALISAMKENPGEFEDLAEMSEQCSSPDSIEAPMQAPTRMPTSGRRLTEAETFPSASPTDFPSNTVFYGFHIEAGVIADASLTIFWKSGGQSDALWLRGCLGAELGAGAEFSFFIMIMSTGKETDVNCGSALFDADVGVGLNLGFGVGVCFITQQGINYVEFTAGAGVGLGGGISVCGVLKL